MCCEPMGPWPLETVGECPECDGNVDKDGDSTEENCFYSPTVCTLCGWKPCDQSC